MARHVILKLGITSVAVLDNQHRPVGCLSLRDLNGVEDAEPAPAPASTIGVDATIDQAARALSRAPEDCDLIVVDSEGRAVGVLSSFDIVRALIESGTAIPQLAQGPTR